MQNCPNLEKQLTQALQSKAVLMEGLWDSPKAFIVHLIRQFSKKPIVVVTGGEREGRLYDDLLFFSKEHIYEFPAWETLPGEEIMPSPDVMGRRLEVLHTLSELKKPPIVLTSVQSLLQKVVGKETTSFLAQKLSKNDQTAFESLPSLLEMLGYKRAKLVLDKGEFAVRGGIVDVFPISALAPYRIEFFGDTIEEIRLFDPMSQTSVGKADSLFISPANEYNLMLQEKKLMTLFDYIPDALIVFDDLLKIEDRVVALESLPFAKTAYFLKFKEVLERPNSKIFWSTEPLRELTESVAKSNDLICFEMFGQNIEAHTYRHSFQKIENLIEDDSLEGFQSLFIGDNAKELEELEKAFPKRPLDSQFITGYLSSGFLLRKEHLLVVPYTELSHKLKVRRSSWRASYHTPVSDFHALTPNDLVVHYHSGIGKYLGVEKQKNHLGIESEFLIIEYAENSKLFVPIAQSHLVSRYIGAHEESPPLHKLGGTQWQKMKTKAQTAIIGYAKDLLHLQAERELKGGFAYPEEGDMYKEFADNFPYQETQDQLNAIKDIFEDMRSPKAMDRLICGDVGYGKTEVAIRAAFKAVSDGQKQVAVLVPTTILAMQHYETFRDRMALFPIRIKVISRFQKASEIKKILEDTAAGNVDILVGTHRLISKDVIFKDLGLIIIDEEQRFGVRAKESLKKLKAGVDAITMTATPIPRTLYLSLIGARFMSVINSPPQDRLPIKTILSEKEDTLIQNALLREFARDGQAYYIHNRVESIQTVADTLQKLVPDARIGVVHGQLTADLIDDIFHAFKTGELDLLVATTIIENGVDIPNANTILIDRADTFGIADLYQMRGRVGRWNKTAYAYLLTPPNKSLPEISQKRLTALAETSGFGGGMRLAMCDLELRGAGDILGVQQSGHVASIGFHLYCKLLKRAIDALKKKTEVAFIETKMEFTFDAKLSEAYIGDSSIRLEIYHRLGECSSNEEIDKILAELKDRFGEPPLCVLWLYHMTRIRLFASHHRILSMKFLKHSIQVEYRGQDRIDHKSIFLPESSNPAAFESALLAKLSSEFRFVPKF